MSKKENTTAKPGTPEIKPPSGPKVPTVSPPDRPVSPQTPAPRPASPEV